MAKKRINSRDKGAVGERELAAEFNRLFGISTRRGQQYSGIEGKDVVGLDGIHVECKRKEKFNAYIAIEQAVRDAKGKDLPVVFHRKNRKPWLVVVRLDDLMALAEQLQVIRACVRAEPPVAPKPKAVAPKTALEEYGYA